MIVKSKLKALPILLAFYISILPVVAVYFSFLSPVAGMVLPLLFLFAVIVFWLTVFRTRACQLSFNRHDLIVKTYFGLGKESVYKFSELDGFITLMESGKGGVTESLFILKEGKRIGSISDFYHKNFKELKKILKDNITDFGEAKSSLKSETLELFR